MASYCEEGTRTFNSGGALAQYLRVKVNGSLALSAAGVNDVEVGVTEEAVFAANKATPVRLRTADGTFKFVASGAITKGDWVYAGASGKVASSGTLAIGIALTTASADGDVIEVLRVSSRYQVYVGEVTLDGTNPTPVSTGLSTIVAAAATLKQTSAPGDDPSWLSVDYSTGTLNVYAWKNTGGSDPTLVASTNSSAVVSVIAIGY